MTPAIMMTSSGSNCDEVVFQTSATPRKIQCNDEDDDEDDDFDHSLISGGPFENTKRKSSWSASSLRKELGSPRMAGGSAPDAHHIHITMNFDQPSQQKQKQPHHAHPPVIISATSSLPVNNHNNSHSHNHNHNHNHIKTGVPSHIQPGIGDNTKGRTSGEKGRSCAQSAGTSFLQELGLALVSCGGGGSGSGNGSARGHCKKFPCSGRASTSTTKANVSTNGRESIDVVNVAASWVRLKDSIHKAVQGDLDAAKEAWRRGTSSQPHDSSSSDMGTNSLGSQDESILTYEQHFGGLTYRQQAQQEEEAMQLRRLTSWGTVGTYETLETSGSPDMDLFNHVVEDDDGIPIDTNLLQNRSKNKMHSGTRRKRVVRFDYPPISSLRECPRTQPEQIRDLFFTENELEQIEDDRYSTISADDVEIVAISTSSTGDSEYPEDGGSSAGGMEPSYKYPSVPKSPSSPPPGSNHSPMNANQHSQHGDSSFRNYVSTPSKRKDSGKKGRRTFSFDDVVSGRGVVGGWKQTATTGNGLSHNNAMEPTKKNGARRRRSSMDSAHHDKGSPTSASSRRMIKSVQIYLRERSVG